MKIVIATPLYPPEIGGPATYAHILAKELPKLGIKVVVVKFSDIRKLPKLIRHYAYYRSVCIAARDADVILALDPVSVGLPALFAARRLRKPLAVKVVGDYAWEQGVQRFGVTESLDDFTKTKQKSFFVRLLQRIQRYVVQNAKNIIVPSAYLQRIVSGWGVTQNNITVIYNAVSVEGSGTVSPQVVSLPQPRIVSVGRLVPWKGMMGLIDAVAKARSTIPDLSLIIVGEGPQSTALETHARQTLKSNFVFTGNISHADTIATMRNCELFVLNTLYEGLSHVLMEALMLGLPIITTNVGGNSELTSPNKTALWTPTNDANRLAETIINVFSDNVLRASISSAGQQFAKKMFGSDAMAKQTADFLRQIR